MASEYEIRRDTIVDGPFTPSQLRSLVAIGKLKHTDAVRKVGTKDWYPASAYPHLFPAAAPQPRATAPPPPAPEWKPAPQPEWKPAPQAAAAPVVQTATATLGDVPVGVHTAIDLSDSGAASHFSPPAPAPGVVTWLLAACATLAAVLLLSLLKPVVGAGGLVAIVAGIGLLFAGLIGLLHSFRRNLELHLGSDNRVVADRRQTLRNLGWVGALALAGLGAGAVLEFATPAKGLTRTMMAALNPPPPPPPPAEPAKPVEVFDPAPWTSADFVLGGSSNTAVAIAYQPSPPGFRILARAEGDQALQAQDAAWEHAIQLIDEDPDLTQRVFAQQGDTVRARLADDLHQVWRTHQYLPAKAPIVSFHDLRQNASRIGFLTQRNEEDITFVPLRPTRNDRTQDGQAQAAFDSEQIRRTDVRPASHRVNLSDDQLKNSADALDYCVYHILKALSADADKPHYVRVAVAAATYEDPKLQNAIDRARVQYERYHATLAIKADAGVINESGVDTRTRKAQVKGGRTGRRIANRARQTADNGAALTSQDAYSGDAIGLSASTHGEVESSDEAYSEKSFADLDDQEIHAFLRKREIDGDPEASAVLNALDAEQTRLQDQLSETSKITSEIRARLVGAGVSVLERERLGSIETERKNWNRPDFESASSQKLLGATHLLVTEVRDRRGNGQYHIAIRLIDVATGRVVAEKEDERTPPSSLDAPPLADTGFLLTSGQPVVITLDSNTRPRTSADLASGAYRGGLPIRMPAVELVPLTAKDKSLEADYKRILPLRTSPLGKQKGKARNRRFMGPITVPAPGGVGQAKVNWETPPVLEGTNTLLGFIDDINATDAGASQLRDVINVDLTDTTRRAALPVTKIPFRDLFSEDVQELDLQRVAIIRPLDTDAVPESHLMRYITYRLAAEMLPQAGRVTDASGSLLTVGLGLKSKLKMSDRLAVHKPGGTDRLEFELGIREVREDWSRVTFNPDEFLFVERYDPSRGDIVYRRHERPRTLTFVEPTVDTTGFTPAPELRELPQKVKTWSQAFTSKLRSSLVALNVPVVDGDGATHRVEVRFIPPDVGNWDCDATVRLIEIQSKNVVCNLDVVVNESQATHWKP